MCIPSAALVALALLLGAVQVAATTTDTFCTRLANYSSSRAASLGWRIVSQSGVTSNVTLVWGSEPARAASALLAVLLRHARLYRDVRLARERRAHDTVALATSVEFSMSGEYTELLIGVSTAWEPVLRTWDSSDGPWPGLAGPRLAEFGFSPVPARRRLLAWLAPSARRPACQGCVRWAFYANETALADCAFVNAVSPQGRMIDVRVVGDCNDTLLQQLQERANATNTSLVLTCIDRASLYTLQNGTISFLFLDYDMWKEAVSVSVVESPPCAPVNFDCTQELDSSIAIRVADVDILQTYAPKLLQFVHDFNPLQKSLRQILERQASGVDIEEAACEWALNNTSSVFNKTEESIYDHYEYTISTYVCNATDDEIKRYDNIIAAIGKLIIKVVKDFDLTFNRYFINCSDYYHMSKRLDEKTRYTDFYNLIGVVSMTVEGATAASATAATNNVPLMLADVVSDEGTDAAATWRVAGRPRHIALALRHFVRESGWSRLAVLSQDTKLAHDCYAALEQTQRNGTKILIHEFPIKEQPTQTVLQNLRDTNARIVFVNADSRAALTILCAAAADGMDYSDGFVWILREWQPDISDRKNELTNRIKHFTVSFWPRTMENVPLTEVWKPLHDELNKTGLLKKLWPPSAISLANAIFSLSMGFRDVFQHHSNVRQDLHSNQMIRLLKESLATKSVLGIGQRQHYAERSIEETLVFVDQWRGGHFHQHLATWRVNASSGAVRGGSSEHASYSRPYDLPCYDGSSGCVMRSGDPFDPTCHDVPCACVLLLLALAPGAVLLARQVLRRRLARMQKEHQIQLIARRQHVATVLAAYLVERAALELCEELGAGRFGSVCRARLREPGRAPRYVAAKALRDEVAPAEESEFLREACTIASLEHAHIVRLVGVCIADGPPLVLMELAFFGDLLGYLRERRHLVEDTGSEELAACGEAEHVSAESLTRLAREAAEALQYLSVRGVVHRDVRAANCLVDLRRSLKLADFGMARDTVAGADGAPEYACRRRGLFPVLWMAPESLAHGVFSAASDVWALGVLVLELVTLGVRPYGCMSPLRVLEYVAAGGSPPLPLDATPQTRGLVRLCWARVPERRPSAAEVAAYLAAWPRALCPALLSERDEPADVDSGFGESPSTELLPPDSPLNSFDQLADIAASHWSGGLDK